MKVTTNIEAKYYHAFCAWNCLELTDVDGNAITLKMTDDDYLELSEILTFKANRILKQRQFEAEEAAKVDPEE
jgi:hypothetical protein